MENLRDIIGGNDPAGGIPPEFTEQELQRIRILAEKDRYYRYAEMFVDRYVRGAEHWEMMTKKQRDWLWKIKDDIEALIKRDRPNQEWIE